MTTTPIIPLADLIADLRTQPTTIAAQTAADRLEQMAADIEGLETNLAVIRSMNRYHVARLNELLAVR